MARNVHGAPSRTCSSVLTSHRCPSKEASVQVQVFTSDILDVTRSRCIGRAMRLHACQEGVAQASQSLLQWRAAQALGPLRAAAAAAAAAKIRAHKQAHGGGEHPALASQHHPVKMQGKAHHGYQLWMIKAFKEVQAPM